MPIKKIFFYLLAALLFFSASGQKTIAINSSINGGFDWSWGPSNDESWGNYEVATFIVSPSMLDANGHLTADFSLSATDAGVFLMMDPVWPTPDKFYCRNNYLPTIGVFAGLPYSSASATSTACYYDGSGTYSKTDFDLSAVFPAINFIDGKKHSIYCYAFAKTNGGGNAVAACKFSVKPSCSIQASSAKISMGDKITLKWSTIGIFSGVISDGASDIVNIAAAEIKSGNGSGSAEITPLVSGVNTYTMTAQGAAGNKTCSAQIDVASPNCVLTADPKNALSGKTAQLNWEIVGAAAAANAVIDNGIGSVASPSGTISTAAISAATVFTLSFTGLDNLPHTCSATIGIADPFDGGLVPCGKLIDDLNTQDIDETKPCGFCASLYMLKNVINFILELSTILGIFILIIAGLAYALSAGNPNRIESAKSAAANVIIGLTVVYVVWLGIAVILQGMGYENITTWNQVDCVLPVATAPSQITDLSATAGNSKVILNWTAPETDSHPITDYKILRSAASNAETHLANANSAATTSYTDNTAVNGVKYYYKVAAINAIGEGELSNEASATPINQRPIIIAGSTAGAQTDYQVLIILTNVFGAPSYTDINADGSNIRFTNSSGAELPYWIETWNDGGTSKIWVNVDSIPAAPSTITIYMVYGDSAAMAMSNGDNTFIFFDDFESGNFNKWDISSGASVSSTYKNSGAYGAQLNSYPGLTKNITSMTNTMLEFRTYNNDQGRNYYGYENTNSNPTNFYLFRAGSDANYMIEIKDPLTFAYTSVIPRAIGWEKGAISASPSEVKWYLKDDFTLVYTYATNPFSIRISFYNQFAGTSAVDDVFIRKYVSPEPIVTIGAQQ